MILIDTYTNLKTISTKTSRRGDYSTTDFVSSVKSICLQNKRLSLS